MKEILQYFPNITEQQKAQLEQLLPLYKEWNDKINVISRKDIDNLYTHHVLHSLGILKYLDLLPGAKVLDLGTGGGFPGVPLAILNPEVQFTLIDGTRKKLRVIEEVAAAIDLKNVQVIHTRAEEHKAQYDFVVSRAVASIDKLWMWSHRLISMKQKHPMPNGLVALKGGNIRSEVKALPKKAYYEITPLNHFYEETYFEEKCIIYVQR